MKMKYIILGIIAGVVLVSLLFLLIVFIMPKKSFKKIESIKHLRFTYTNGYAMNAYIDYEIDFKNNKYIATIKPYGFSEEDAKEFELTNEMVHDIENKLNEYKVSNWDGFHKRDKYVLDGDSFSLNISYGDDLDVEASGYMSWPTNYREVRDYLDSTLGSLYKK